MCVATLAGAIALEGEDLPRHVRIFLGDGYAGYAGP